MIGTAIGRDSCRLSRYEPVLTGPEPNDYGVLTSMNAGHPGFGHSEPQMNAIGESHCLRMEGFMSELNTSILSSS